MTKGLNLFYSLTSRCNKQLNRFFSPHPAYISNPIEHQLALARNKGIVIIYLILSFVVILSTFVNGSSPASGILTVLTCYSVILSIYLSCAYHPQIFKVGLTIICAIYGPLTMNVGEDGIHRVWHISLIIPVVSYAFLGSFPWFIVQVFIQLIQINTIFTARMEEAVTYMSPERFTQALRQTYSLAFVVNSIIIVLMSTFMVQAMKRIVIAEKGMAEAENQKTFLYSFTHELRNLINSISGNIKLVSLENHVPTRVKELLSNAEVCGELLLYLVNNVLDTRKMEVEELELDLRPTHIYDSLEKIWSICSELIKHKDLQGKMKVQKNLPEILQTDQYRLMQIFMNITGNAAKFTERGSIDISVEWLPDCREVTEKCFQPYPFNEDDDQDEGLFEKTRAFTIFGENYTAASIRSRRIDRSSLDRSVRSSRGVLKVAILDTGCGMTKEQTVQLFHKFTQVTTDASKRKLGTGLGLFIVKQICERMNGDVKVFSKEDKGSCFVICIPMDTMSGAGEQIEEVV